MKSYASHTGLACSQLRQPPPLQASQKKRGGQLENLEKHHPAKKSGNYKQCHCMKAYTEGKWFQRYKRVKREQNLFSQQVTIHVFSLNLTCEKQKSKTSKGIAGPDYNQGNLTYTSVQLRNRLVSNLSYIFKECSFHPDRVSMWPRTGSIKLYYVSEHRPDTGPLKIW